MRDEYCKKKFSTFIMCKNKFMSDNMLDLLNNPDFFLEKEDTHIIQNNFKSKLGIVQIDSRKIVIKRHNYKSGWHRFRRFFRPTRASKNWHFSKILMFNNIWVPTPVAYVETRIGFLRGMSYFMYEYVAGMTGEEYFKKNINSRTRIEHAMDLVINLMNQIKNLHLIHGDIRMSNLIFKNNKICLLDLDDIKPITWYQIQHSKTRDIRGLKKDIGYNIPPTLQSIFLKRLNSL
ncbi:lipopolysaccharide kinase InaA family protein [Desulfobacula toluolica]|uniref:Uncharacterized protein, kinase-like domain n=1 Tax=Desulfobacula toluolica (strain DSM 7467 / Tol2) TaxID=651182 RepID=K0NEE6_DESTT|nr:lipopolysaccharide kinase InaA family protein [Desulfobacula toluolica]CCK79416.1 uncharacterized protein, kinase-like domain [Desulfobacula toluolica Tol2]